MDHADRLEALITGNLDTASKRVHGSMAPRGHEATAELPIADEAHTDAELLALGIKFLDEPASRRRFRRVVLPQGWRVAPSDHHMYSFLRDEQNRRRAQIGYSAQDGWASIFVMRRFDAGHTSDDWGDHEAPAIACIYDYDSGNDKKELWRGPVFGRKKIDGKRLGGTEDAEIARLRAQIEAFEDPPTTKAAKVAAAKLDELAPEWRKVSAYWDASGDAIVWPPHETPPDTRAEYVVMTECLSGGHHRDGGRHGSFKAKDDDEAQEKLPGAITSVTSFYDEVRWTILCGSRVVARGTARKPSYPRDMFAGQGGAGLWVDPRTGRLRRGHGHDKHDDEY